MHAIALVLALIATPALADVAGVASVIDGTRQGMSRQPKRVSIGRPRGTLSAGLIGQLVVAPLVSQPLGSDFASATSL